MSEVEDVEGEEFIHFRTPPAHCYVSFILISGLSASQATASDASDALLLSRPRHYRTAPLTAPLQDTLQYKILLLFTGSSLGSAAVKGVPHARPLLTSFPHARSQPRSGIANSTRFRPLGIFAEQRIDEASRLHLLSLAWIPVHSRFESNIST
jgi:hypothetical protein